MRDEFKVNDSKRKALVLEMKKKYREKIWLVELLYKISLVITVLVFIVPTIGVIGRVFQPPVQWDEQAVVIVFVVMLVAFILACLVGIVPMYYKISLRNKYLWTWLGRKEEVICFCPKVLEWAHYDDSHNRNYQVLQMRYAEIVRIEYDSEQKVLRVYGPAETKEWDSINRIKCVETISRDYDIPADALHFTIAEYFDGFEEIKAKLVEMTGLEIVECNRAFSKSKEIKL